MPLYSQPSARFTREKKGRFLTGTPAPLLLLAAFVWVSGPSQQPSVSAADLILQNARVYTLDSHRSWAEAVAIQGEKILAVGSASELARYRGKKTRVLDAGGRLILPSFTDCHIHFLEGSLSLERADLNNSGSVEEIQRRLREYAKAHPGSSWILGMGWNYSDFGAATLPDKKYLDEIFPDRPVFLDGFDGHTSWANSKALELAGITRDTHNPPNGEIVRDPATGEPTGALKESASQLVQRVAPKPTDEEKLTALSKGMVEANKAGLVRLHSAGGDAEEISLFNELRRRGKLTIRLYAARVIDPPELTAKTIAELEAAQTRYHDDWIDTGVVKFFLDGVIESHTAAMLAPYSDDAALSGSLKWQPEKYRAGVAELDRRGFQIFTHAIGDRAVRLALDAYEQAQKASPQTVHRDRIEHIETISADDIPRFGALGVIASMQPFHASPDNDTLNVWAKNTGPERATRAFAWHSIAAAGGRLAFGSDWPVVTLNPWIGIQTAVTRQTIDGKPAGGWTPDQRVTLEQAIEAYTRGAAYAGRREKMEGSLEPGKLADLIVVSQDLFKIEPHEISKTRVLLTLAGGKSVYQAPEWEQANTPDIRSSKK